MFIIEKWHFAILPETEVEIFNHTLIQQIFMDSQPRVCTEDKYPNRIY